MATFGDILLSMAIRLVVAVYPEQADNRPTLPEDPATLDRLKRACNEGRERFYDSNPRFNFLRPFMVLTLDEDGDGSMNVDGDAAIYRLRSDLVGTPIGECTWEFPEGSSGSGNDLLVTSTSQLLKLRSQVTATGVTGRPQAIAFEVDPAGPPAPGQATPWLMRVYPTPDAAYRLHLRLPRRYVPLADVAEEEPSGYPQAVVSWGVRQFVEQGPISTGPNLAEATAEASEALARVAAQERERAPRSLGVTVAPRVRVARRWPPEESPVTSWTYDTGA